MQFKTLATGYYLEGLVVDRETVFYTDVTLFGINRLTEAGTVNEWLPERRWVGSMIVNADGSVLVSGPDNIAWFNPETGKSGVLIDTLGGEKMLGANEMCADGKGGLYFGTLDAGAIEGGETPKPASLWHLDADLNARKLADGLSFCNGVSLSLDGKLFFHNETFTGTSVFDVKPDGTLANQRPMFDTANVNCDGMAIDTEGCLWITGYDAPEVWRVTTAGEIVERVRVPGDGCSNICFGGADNRDLFVTAVPGDAGEGLKNGELPTEQKSVLGRAKTPYTGYFAAPPRFKLG